MDEQHYVGRVLPGGYRVERFIAAGGFAWVYLAQTPRGERCAVKIPFHATEEGRKRFIREIKILKALPANPHCVAYIGDGATREGLPFVAMEFVDGITLTRALEAWPRWPLQHACVLARQICFALSGLHALGVANRDVKPDNIMLTRSWQVKLMDFGLVKDAQGLLRLLESQDILGGRAFTDNLDRGMLAGSPEYMAPEQFTDSSLQNAEDTQTDTWTDVFSLGLILYQLVTGQKLFPFDWNAKSQAEFARKLLTYLHAREAFRDEMLGRPPDVSPELWKIICRALRSNPRRRYRTATDLGLDLERLLVTGQATEHDEEATSAFDAERFMALHNRNPSAVMSAIVEQGFTDPTGEFHLSEPAAADESMATGKLDLDDLRSMYKSDPHMLVDATLRDGLRSTPNLDPSEIPPLAALPVRSTPFVQVVVGTPGSPAATVSVAGAIAPMAAAPKLLVSMPTAPTSAALGRVASIPAAPMPTTPIPAAPRGAAPTLAARIPTAPMPGAPVAPRLDRGTVSLLVIAVVSAAVTLGGMLLAARFLG